MPKTYSIAEAKNNLARLVHEAEDGRPVELTRRGRPVAIVISLDEYRRLSSPKLNFWQSYQIFRENNNFDEMDIDIDKLFEGVRDPSEGPNFSW